MVSPNSLPSPVDYVTSAVDCVTSGEGCSSRDPHLDVVSSTINSDHSQPSGLQGLQKDNVSTPTALRYSIPQVSYYVSRYCYQSNVYFPSCEPMFVAILPVGLSTHPVVLLSPRLRAQLYPGVRFDYRASPIPDWGCLQAQPLLVCHQNLDVGRVDVSLA